MYEQVKDQQAWQLEQGQELSALKEKIDATQEIGVANHVLDGQTAMGLAGLDGRVELLEKQGRFLLDQQEQDSNTWHNITFNLHEEVSEGEEKMATLQDLLDVQRKLNQQLCLNFNKAHREMLAAFKVAHQEKRTLGAEGVLPSRQIESFLRVFKQFTHTLPSRQVVGYLSICPPL